MAQKQKIQSHHAVAASSSALVGALAVLTVADTSKSPTCPSLSLSRCASSLESIETATRSIAHSNEKICTDENGQKSDFVAINFVSSTNRKYGSASNVDQLIQQSQQSQKEQLKALATYNLQHSIPNRARNMSTGSSILNKTNAVDTRSNSTKSENNFLFLRRLRGSTKSVSTSNIKDDKQLSKKEECLEGSRSRVCRALAHFDCQSVSWSVAYLTNAANLSDLRRRNTGASAASGSRDSYEEMNHSNCNAKQTNNELKTIAKLVNVQVSLAMTSPRSYDLNIAALQEDVGDGHSNQLLSSCAFFRNELGGEPVRIPAFTRITNSRNCLRSGSRRYPDDLYHRPPSCNNASFLEPLCQDATNEVFNNNLTREELALSNSPHCFDEEQHNYLIEYVDHGACYYRNFFYTLEHQNWFGVDDELGPLAISLRREKLADCDTFLLQQQAQTQTAESRGDLVFLQSLGNGLCDKETHSSTSSSELSPGGYYSLYVWRIIVRSRHLRTLRVSLLEDAVPCSLRHSALRGIPPREVLRFVAPDLPLTCLRQGNMESATQALLLKLDEQSIMKNYKVGVLLCKAGQNSEEDMYNNEHISPPLEEFMEHIATKVVLHNFSQYKGGLDTKSDTTGSHSYYTKHGADCEIMFHVSAMLPYTANNRQQLMRKRHIGNDIVTIVFQEPEALPFSPVTIRSQFQHVFIIVRVHNPCSEITSYSIAVSRSCDVPMFGPPLPRNAQYKKSPDFVHLLLTKIINGENAAHRSQKFIQMQMRTREDYLRELAMRHVTGVTLDNKASGKLFMGSGRKKDKMRLCPTAAALRMLKGGLTWTVSLTDFSTGHEVSCQLAIGWNALVFVENTSRMVICTLPTRAIIGWRRISHQFSLRLYYHHGEYVQMSCISNDERDEVEQRLLHVTSSASETMEITIDALQAVQANMKFTLPEMLVHSVHPDAQLQIREGSRVVELAHIPACILSKEDITNILQNNKLLHIVAVPPSQSHQPALTLKNKPDVFFTNNNYASRFDLPEEEVVHQQELLNPKSCYSESHSLQHEAEHVQEQSMPQCTMNPNLLYPFDSNCIIKNLSRRATAPSTIQRLIKPDAESLDAIHHTMSNEFLFPKQPVQQKCNTNDVGVAANLEHHQNNASLAAYEELEKQLHAVKESLAAEMKARQHVEEKLIASRLECQRLLEQNTNAAAQLISFAECIFNRLNDLPT